MSQMCKLLKQYKTVRPKNMHSYWRLLLLFFLYARPTYFKYSEKFRDRGKHWSVAIGMMRIMLFLLNVAIADNQVSCKRYRQVRTWVVHGCTVPAFFFCVLFDFRPYVALVGFEPGLPAKTDSCWLSAVQSLPPIRPPSKYLGLGTRL